MQCYLVVVDVLCPLSLAMVMSGWSCNLTTLFLGRLRPPKHLNSTKCANVQQQLTTALVESPEEETQVAEPSIESGTSGS